MFKCVRFLFFHAVSCVSITLTTVHVCILFNDALNTFYLRLYGVGHMVNEHSDSEREETRIPTWATLSDWQQGFICIIPQRG